MDYYSPETYGERIAGVYDQYYAEFDPATIQVLADLAQGGKALELGIGTGQIAIPLSQSGVSVQGIDISESMVARLHAKPGGEKIQVAMGSFADVDVVGQFTLIYVVFNTFYSLLTQEEQVKCFQNVAEHLTPHGAFVIEAFVPDLSRFTAGQTVRLTRIDDKEVQLDVTQLDADKQIVNTQHMVCTEHGITFYPVRLRFIWPAEMDLMAQLGHLRLKERWADWKKAPFTSSSRMYISVYQQDSR